MSLNDEIQGLGHQERRFIFKEGVQYKHMTGKEPIYFRIAPAFNPQDPNPQTSWQPFVTADGKATDWGKILRISRFIGHGAGGFGTRQDLLSLRSFAVEGQDVYCPLEQLLKCIKQMSSDWGYLIEDRQLGGTKDRAAFSRPTAHFVVNLVDLNQQTLGMQLGVFTTSATSALIHAKHGLAFQPDAKATPELVTANPMAMYANGDITHPETGPGLILQKGETQGEYSRYGVGLAVNQQTRTIYHRAFTAQEMAERRNMADLASFINIPEETELIEKLIQLLNMRSPAGYHEWALLKMAFPEAQIPEPPAAPAAAAAGSGFGPSAGAAVTTPPPTAASPGGPVVGAPAAVAPPFPVTPAPAASAPVATAVPPATAPAVAPGTPPAVAPAPAGVVPPGTAPVAVAPGTPAPAAPAPGAAAAVANQGKTPEVAQAADNAAANTAVPGDAVPEFDRNGFLNRLGEMGQAQQ